MGIIKKIDEVRSLESNPDYVKKSHPKLFRGLGCIPGEYNIELKDAATPYNLTNSSPIPLLERVETEIKRMVDLDVIERVDQPTDWCSPVVVVPKQNGVVRICGDFIQLNTAVK